MKSISYIFTFLTGIFITIFFFRSCSGCNGGQTYKDTISHQIDTVWKKISDSIVYVPQPTDTIYLRGRVLHDTLETLDILTTVEKVDSARILKQYFAQRNYSDTLLVDYGKVIVDDTITQNRIIGRGFRSELNIPVIKETTILAQRKRTVAYLGITGVGNNQNVFYAVGGSFGLKLKSDKYIGIVAMLTKDGQPAYGFDLKLPIRLSKK